MGFNLYKSCLPFICLIGFLGVFFEELVSFFFVFNFFERFGAGLK